MALSKSTVSTTSHEPEAHIPEPALEWDTLDLTVEGVSIELATVTRFGPLSPILFLHGFGGTKEDYIDIALNPTFAGRSFILYDSPGSGASTCSDFSKVSIPFLVSLAQAVLNHFKIRRYHLVGHSMGGLTGLLLAEGNSAVLSFVNIKGNLAPEDCFLSRQIVDYPDSDPEKFMEQFILRTKLSSYYSAALYATSLRYKVQPSVVKPTFASMVEISDSKPLLSIFESLPIPKMYMFGEQYKSLTYLPRLADAGIELAMIPSSGHFVMYSNPVAMWERIAASVGRAGE
ncbi:uncharacterized protein BHQ10_004267 [Talaromyces amestolkiae]|uniref:AB hydrolase-1 domain-containing protein n=1 Tax=Talaromyces amestolkiae TaxID=1196081 RepID=A0A364KXH9_TALAM|nr:uncharacterized protein BHQ10_004267 [Talaromyces amestolkiae]RAO68255.1 hypothetical protein BHQ10_004267 [Talaromyces amestolkiae]